MLLLLASLYVHPALAAVNLIDKDDWKVDLGGFIETDLIYDTTKSFNENIGNNPVVAPNGQKGRTQLSVRNSRLSFNVMAPTVGEWRSRGYMELDLLGYDAAPPSQSEASFFNNPTMRIRHGYLSTEKEGWQFLSGQTWSLFGWQPYYFMPTIQVSPIPAMLYGRTAQIRMVKAFDSLQMALGIMRPPQRDGNLPGLEGGVRWAMNSWAGAFTGGATGSHKPQPLSVGLSGTVRNFEITTDPATSQKTASYTGSAGAVDVLIPVIPSSDGKDVAHNLVLGGEFTIGSGYGDQFGGWTGLQPNPLSSAGSNPDKGNNLDAGIGGFGNDGFTLIKLQTYNAYAQYHWSESLWFSGGYSQLSAINMTAININNGTKVAYDKEQSYFFNISHDCTKQVRVALEYANVQTHYVDGTTAQDNRFQYSTFFMF